ncbi:MAG TPA: porin family protein [Bacteroidales bacterium]|nr:porin family protein [Bacteroidales bacterium]
MKILYKYAIFLLVIFTVPVKGIAQESGSCTEKLKDAQTSFERGQLSRVPELLLGCLKSGFTREESITAYKLIIQTYLLEDRLDLADSVMFVFLKKEPEYQVNPTDHSGFVHLFNNFESKKVVQIAVRTGLNVSYPTFVDPNSVFLKTFGSDYSIRSNIYGSFEAKLTLNNKFEVNAEIGFSQVSFDRVEKNSFSKSDYSETQQRLEIPLTVTYNIKTFGRFTAFARVGAGPSFILNTTSSPALTSSYRNNPDGRSGNNISRSDSRIAVDLFVQAGAGLKFKVREGYIFSDVRSNFGLRNLIVNSPLNGDLNNYFYYCDDKKLHINTLNFNLGYILIFYKPLKKEE